MKRNGFPMLFVAIRTILAFHAHGRQEYNTC